MLRKSARDFDAAGTDRLTEGWTATPLTADEVVSRHQRVLVARSRQQANANDYLKGFFRLCRQNIVGSAGIALQAQTRDGDRPDAAANAALEAWWKTWQKPGVCDITGKRSFRRLCQTAIQSAARDGEFFFREVRGRAAGPAHYALQHVDAQRCPVDYDEDNLPGGAFIRQGIEFTREGRPIAYYFMTNDPATNGYTFNGRSLERIPADQIIHGFIEEIPGQRRGIPWAATSLWRLNMMAGFERASLVNARTTASIGGFITWKEGTGPDEDEDEDELMTFEADGGVFQELPEGAEPHEFNGNYPRNEFTPFLKAMLRGAGAGLGVAYVSFANDLEGVNFSSIRQGVLDEREHWMDLQEWLIETLVERAYAGALKPALLQGRVVHKGIRLRPALLTKYLDVRWQARRWAWVDPQKDINAESTAMGYLLQSPSELIRKRGGDPEQVWKGFAADIQAMKDAGIPDEMISIALQGAVGASAAPAPGEEDDDTPPAPAGGQPEGAEDGED